MTEFNEIWVANRKRYRKGLTGTRLVRDPETGYMDPHDRRGFTAEMRATFIARFRICSNMKQICQSVRIERQTVYDAIAVDEKFRREFIEAYKILGRSKRLNDEMVKLAASEKSQVLTDLKNIAERYK